jgi:flagellar basal-body rod protein FlgF
MSTDPLRDAGRAMAYWELRQEVASHNVANASTPGYKGQRVFAELLDGLASPRPVVRDDLSAGPIRDTGRPLDLAMEGDGFLVVDGPGG